MKQDRDGVIYSTKTIYFGTYEHKSGYVAYIGGTELHYALWREASMVWPELPRAQYFKESQEPIVHLEIPNMADFGGDGSIEDLGQEDVRAEDGSVTKVFKYRAATAEQAVHFIEMFQISEEGVAVNVEAPGVRYGRDINGIFELQD